MQANWPIAVQLPLLCVGDGRDREARSIRVLSAISPFLRWTLEGRGGIENLWPSLWKMAACLTVSASRLGHGRIANTRAGEYCVIGDIWIARVNLGTKRGGTEE